MKTITFGILALALGAFLSFGAVEIGERTASADAPLVVDAGVVLSDAGATVVLPPAAQLPDPIEHPAIAFTDLQLARKTGWPLAVWGLIAMIGKALAYGRDRLKGWPVLGKLSAWLAEGKRVMVVAAIGSFGAAGYDMLLAGGTVTAALIASVVAVAGTTHSTTQPANGSSSAGATTVAMLALLIGGALAFGSSGCSGSQKATTINATIIAADAGCTAFAAYVDTHQETLINTATSAADATAKVAEWHAQADKIRTACAAVYAATKIAVDANNDNAIATVTQAAALLQSTLKTYGIGGSL